MVLFQVCIVLLLIGGTLCNLLPGDTSRGHHQHHIHGEHNELLSGHWVFIQTVSPMVTRVSHLVVIQTMSPMVTMMSHLVIIQTISRMIGRGRVAT
jgi:hypothetical protein